MTTQDSDLSVGGQLVCLDDFERHAVKSMARASLGYIRGGADDEVTLKDNVAAFRRYQIMPRVLRDVSACNTETSILGHRIAFPICIAATSFHRLAHPDGELATARAASSMKTALVLSTYATSSLEAVSAAVSDDAAALFLQLYVSSDEDATRRLISRALDARYSAIVLTVDVPVNGKRRADLYNSFRLPAHLQLPNIEMSSSGKRTVPDLTDTYVSRTLTWDTVTWLMSITDLPVVVKGILTAEDAVEAVTRGVSGIVVSNHGARQLDTVPATLDVLSDVVRAVAGRCEVYLDGGVRTGTDVFKALALGAKVVFIGRPVIYGLAYDGEAGVRQVLSILRDEFKSTMALAGCSSVDEIKPSFIRRPTHSPTAATASKL